MPPILPPILNAQEISKSFGAQALFTRLSFTVSEGDRIGLIGPNGSGKSTLLGILAGAIAPDSGQLAVRKHARLGYVAQISEFAAGETVRSVLESALRRAAIPESDWDGRLHETLGRTGFSDFLAPAATLSGGWRKRLAIAEALALRPDVLLLDEPTNHLDLLGIAWLESLLASAPFACVVVSHDRYFLENAATVTVELNRAYPDGLLRAAGNYSRFLEKKEEFLAAQSKRRQALAGRVRTEIEWLRRGPKARATKAKARIDNANELIGELARMNARSGARSVSIDLSSSGRQSKRLIELDGIECGYGQTLFSGLDFTVAAGMRVGLVGPNGCGKSTLLKLLKGDLEPKKGAVNRAPSLRIAYFDQERRLDPEITLRRALAADGDSVLFRGRIIHVSSWASRFLFAGEQLNQPIGSLSGGERARVLIARLMLEPADLLLLDEPTNDLDIPTLEVLEESLLEFPGALVLVTHDRYLLDRVSTTVLGLDGRGQAQLFADYRQWEDWRSESPAPRSVAPAAERLAAPPAKKRHSYLEAREFAGMEERIAAAERDLEQRRRRVADPAIACDALQLQEALAALEASRAAVDALYERWAELEVKVR